MVWGLCLLAGAAAAAEPRAAMSFRDLPGTGGSWQEAQAIIHAPPERVRSWMIDYDRWPSLFSDVASAEVLGNAPDGSAVVRFQSRIAGRLITVRERQTSFGLEYDGEAHDVTTRGRIYFLDLGNGSTRVIMQSTADVHGFWRPFAFHRLKRRRSFEIMRSQLESLDLLSRH